MRVVDVSPAAFFWPKPHLHGLFVNVKFSWSGFYLWCYKQNVYYYRSTIV